MKVYTESEIKSFKGYFDDDGFYLLEEGGFFDPWGYKFELNSEDGLEYDSNGGYYSFNGDNWLYIANKSHENEDH
jgi:hypothetical protein